MQHVAQVLHMIFLGFFCADIYLFSNLSDTFSERKKNIAYLFYDIKPDIFDIILFIRAIRITRECFFSNASIILQQK